MRTAVVAIPRPWNSGRTIQPISDIAAPASSCDHSATEPATTPGALSSGMIILIHAASAAACWTSRATFAAMPSRGSGPPSSAIMTGSQRIRT